MNRFSLLVLALLPVCAGRACDICAIYSAQSAQNGEGWYAGLFEQYSKSTTLREDGDKIPNSGDAKLDSFVTQAFAGYRVNEVWNVQINVPYIVRDFDRPASDGVSRDKATEQGTGDAVLLASARVFHAAQEDKSISVSVLGGVKMPTGDSDRLRETPEPESEDEVFEGGLHDHDIALGSGSWDSIIGASLCGRAGRWFLCAETQYSLRTEGAHDFQYANDLTWCVQPGYTFWLADDGTASLGVNFNGEHKGEDKRGGEADDDSAMDAVYAGPALTVTRGENLNGELGLDLPLQQDGSGAQLVPDFRIRAALTVHF